MKKAIIMGFINFPRGSAPANYVQYLGLALKELGYDVIIYSNLNKSELIDISDGDYFYKGMKVRSIEVPLSNKVKHFIQYNFLLGNIMSNLLKECQIVKDDIVITYGNICLFQEKVYKTAKKLGAKTFACVTEHFSSSHYKHGVFSPYYWRYCYTMSISIPRAKNIFTISRHLNDYYKKKKCKTMILPIMADPFEYEFKEKNNSSIINKIIFPSNGFVKDALSEMINGISKLTDEELNNLELHFTGINIKKLVECSNERFKSLIGKKVIIHSWLDYDELVKLYKEMDFLLLAREDNQMTRANFPSKVPEVMCYGVIPIASKVGDYTDLYLKNNENSIIFEGFSAESCAGAIRRAISLKNDEKRNLSNAARKCSIEKFYYKTWEKNIFEFISRGE